MSPGARPGSRRRGLLLLPLVLLVGGSAPASPRPCPEGMAAIEGRFCVDRHEAALERLDAEGRPVGLHPHNREIGGEAVRVATRPRLHTFIATSAVITPALVRPRIPSVPK